MAIEGLVELGMTPSQAIVAATRNGAIAARGLNDFGTLEPGKLADLVILTADPLADISQPPQGGDGLQGRPRRRSRRGCRGARALGRAARGQAGDGQTRDSSADRTKDTARRKCRTRSTLLLSVIPLWAPLCVDRQSKTGPMKTNRRTFLKSSAAAGLGAVAASRRAAAAGTGAAVDSARSAR